MAGNFNRVILLGNLTRDIELRQVGGTSVGKFGIAVNRRYTTSGGEAREEVAFVDCEGWGKMVEVMAKYLSKGSSVLVEGRLKLDQWEDKEGKKHQRLKVVVDTFQFADPRGEGSGSAPSEPRGEVYHDPTGDKDIPF